MSVGVTNTLKAAPIEAALVEEITVTLTALALEIAGTAQRTLRNMNGVYTGLLIGSIAPDPPHVLGAGGFEVRVGTPVETGTYYEFGTRPHWPPLYPIAKWVEQKIQPHVLSVGVEFSSGRAFPTRKGTRRLTGDKRQRAIMSVARAIQRSIAKYGTRPHPFFARALDELGAPYQLEPQESGWGYRIDVASWLKVRGDDIIQRVVQRLGNRQ